MFSMGIDNFIHMIQPIELGYGRVIKKKTSNPQHNNNKSANLKKRNPHPTE
jgi:hypothetical protein